MPPRTRRAEPPADSAVRAREHVPRRTARERQQQDPLGGDAAGDERGDARAERRRLPGPGAGEHEQVAVAVQRGGALLGVQLLEPVGGVGGLRRDEHPFAERYGRLRTTPGRPTSRAARPLVLVASPRTAGAVSTSRSRVGSLLLSSSACSLSPSPAHVSRAASGSVEVPGPAPSALDSDHPSVAPRPPTISVPRGIGPNNRRVGKPMRPDVPPSVEWSNRGSAP